MHAKGVPGIGIVRQVKSISIQFHFNNTERQKVGIKDPGVKDSILKQISHQLFTVDDLFLAVS